MSESNFSSPTRQPALALVVLFGDNLRRLVQFVIAIIAGSFLSDQVNFGIVTTIIIGAVALAIITILQYLRFKFHIKDGEFILERGILKRERLSIPLERIQTVQLSQNLLQQVVQLTGVKIDTAGSGKEELIIKALTRKNALALQEILQKEATRHSPETGVELDSITTPPSKEILVKLSIGKLLVVGLTQNHLRSGLIAIAFVFGTFSQFQDLLYDQLDETIEKGTDEIVRVIAMSGLLVFLASASIFILFSVIVSLVRSVLTHFNLEASLSGENIKVSSGLLKRNEFTIPLNKIQILTWKGNFLRRIPGFESVLIQQSKSEGTSRKLNVEIPACYPPQTSRLEEKLFPEMQSGVMHEFAPHSFYMIYKFGIRAALWLVPCGFFAFSTDWKMGLAAYIMILPLQFLWIRRYYKSIVLRTNGEVLSNSKGWLFTDRSVIRTFKVQSVRFKQSIFQERRGIAHLKLYTAGGNINLRFLPVKLARELHNFLLYKVETSERSWM